MAIDPAFLVRLADIEMPEETLRQVLRAYGESVTSQTSQTRSAGAVRQERYRKNKASQGDVTIAKTPALPSPQEKTQPPSLPSPTSLRSATATDVADTDEPAPVDQVETARQAKRRIDEKALLPMFADFWTLCPRKTNKDAAWNAYKRRVLAGQATVEELAAGMKAHAIEMTGKEQQFIPHPSSWINAGGWKDERPGAQPSPGNGPPVDGQKMTGHTYFKAEHPSYAAWARWRARSGKTCITDKNGGWFIKDEELRESENENRVD